MIVTVTLNLAVDKTLSLNEFNIGTVNRPNKMIKKAGGKGINVARVINNFNKKVVATGFLGNNEKNIILSNLEEEDIKNDFVNISGDTRTCLAIIDESKNITTEVFDTPPVINKNEFSIMKQKLFDLSKEADIVTLNGSLPSGLPDNAYRELIEIISQNSKVFLDTSGQPLKEGIKANPFLIKPNHKEFENLLEKDLNTKEELINYLNDFANQYPAIKIIIISLGENGLIFSYDNEIYEVKPINKIKVKNPVGSGDAILGGIGVKLNNDENIFDAIKFGVACATSNLKYMSAGILNKKEVYGLVKNIEIKNINV